MAVHTTSVLSNNVQTAYSQKTLMAFQPRLVFDKLCDVKWSAGSNDPFASNNVQFPIYNALNANTTALSETTDPASKSLSNSLVSITAQEYGDVVSITRKLKDTSYNSVIPVSPIVARAAALAVDLIARAAFDSQTGSDYVSYTNGSAKSAITASDTATISDFTTGAGDMRSADVLGIEANEGVNAMPSMLGNDPYAVVVHPKVMADLKAETGAGAFRTPAEYAKPENIYKGEFGSFDNLRFIVSSLATIDYDAGSATSTDIDNGNTSTGDTVITLTSGTGFTAGNTLSITTGSDKHTYKIASVSTNDVTLGVCIALNDEPYYTKTAGLIMDIADADAVATGVNVYTSYIVGHQAIGKAMVADLEFPVTKPSGGLERQFDFGWYANMGYGEVRPEAMHKIFSAATRG